MTKRYFIDQIVLNAGSPNFESLLGAMYDSFSQPGAAKLYIDQVRPIVDQYHREEISLGKCTELLNELIQPTSSMTAEGMYKEWANLVEFVGSSIAGQRGVSIDKLNKVMDAVQKYVERLKAFASSHQTGWYSREQMKAALLFGVKYYYNYETFPVANEVDDFIDSFQQGSGNNKTD